ncbi:hypothetical protein BJX66DRAFT_335676 [Aspergillus keveii]|uniref:Uncharacterized protein n=1 Tax=Aspergillus keveii TaxID=714993 RepID=A0ABR4GCD4_9EURO
MAYNLKSRREAQPHTEYTYDTHDVYTTASPGPNSNTGHNQQQQQYTTSQEHTTTTLSSPRDGSYHRQRRRHSITENHTVQSDPDAMQRYQGTTSRHVSTTMDNGQISQQEVWEKSQVQDLEPRDKSGLKLRLDLNLDVEVELKAKIRGDLTLALL